MPLLLGVVVVAVDLLLPLHVCTDPRREAGDDPIHHLLTVEQGVLLRPPHLADVRPELVRALGEVGEVLVRQGDPPLLAQLARHRDVVLGDLVADAPRPGVQEQPHPVLLVEGHLDEVVAGPERAELELPPACVGRRVEARVRSLAREQVQPLTGVVPT